MSELKVHHFVSIDELHQDDLYTCSGLPYYLKSEADKVIEEKDEIIDELKEHIDELQKATDSAWSKVNAIYDELRHQKYKRFLAMADALTWEHDYLVDFVSDDFPNVRFKRRHRIKWVNSWLALAEEPTWAKFLQLIHKEAK